MHRQHAAANSRPTAIGHQPEPANCAGGLTVPPGAIAAPPFQRVPQLVNTRKAAQILGRSAKTLKRWRYEGVGPAYVSMGGRVSYDVNVLLKFIEDNTRVPSVRAAVEAS